MEPILNNCFTLITGASSGIGKALAEECSRRKMNLFLVALPDSGLELVAEELTSKFGNRITTLSIDLTEIEAPGKVYDFARSSHIHVNMLINNAGIGHVGSFEQQDGRLIDEIIMLNIRATTQLTRLFINDLIKLPVSYILNLSSFLSFVPAPLKCVYGASKSYLLFFSQSLRLELKKYNVMVASLHPSGVATNSRVTENIKSIPFYAKLTILSASQVARYAMHNFLKGKDQIIPGFFTRFFFWFGFIMPYGLVMKMMYNIFCKK